MEPPAKTAKTEIIYELWSDEDMRWIEVPCPTIELAAFLEAWCEKNASIFRRRPFGPHRPSSAGARATAVVSEGKIVGFQLPLDSG